MAQKSPAGIDSRNLLKQITSLISKNDHPFF